MVFIYNVLPGHDLAITIILMTIVIKLVLWPLSHQAIESQKKIQDIQPEMEALKKKYADNKEALGKAMMELYKERNVNPFSSCLPLLIQLPFLFAVFHVFQTGFQNGALDLVYSFISRPEQINHIALGFIDLSKPYILLAVAAGAAQYWQAWMTLAKKNHHVVETSPNNLGAAMNKQMLYFMPALTVFIGLTLPGGLSLYWLVTTLLTILQQFIIFKKNNSDSSNEPEKTIEGEVIN